MHNPTTPIPSLPTKINKQNATLPPHTKTKPKKKPLPSSLPKQNQTNIHTHTHKKKRTQYRWMGSRTCDLDVALRVSCDASTLSLPMALGPTRVICGFVNTQSLETDVSTPLHNTKDPNSNKGVITTCYLRYKIN